MKVNLIEKSTEKYREATKLNLSDNYGFHLVPRGISGKVKRDVHAEHQV